MKGKKKRRSSIARKMSVMLIILGIITWAMCFLNLMAFEVMRDFSTSLHSAVLQYEEQAGGTEEYAELVAEIEYLFEHMDIKIDGTYSFDLILGGVAIVVTVIAIIVAMRLIVKPTKHVSSKLEEVIESIKRNEGDLTIRATVKSRDEVGRLAGDINDFIEFLQEYMITMRDNADALQKSLEVVEGQVEESNTSVTNVSSATEQMAASMQEMSATIQEIANASTEVFDKVQDISQSADASAENIAQIQKRVEEMRNNVLTSKETTTNVIEDMQESLEASVRDSASVKQIQELTNDILSIASQTNLLALNASIEAARAGEAGKGFAVVAEEIRVLADNSQQTANNIQEISNIVIAAVGKLADNSKELLSFLDSTVMKDYDEFVDIMNQYNDDTEMLNQVFDDFAGKASDMESTMETMNTGINDIAVTVDESAKAVTTVAADASDMVSAMMDIQTETTNNKNIADQMITTVRKFKNL